MKLYLVKRTDSIGWDEYDAIVIRAESKERAAEVALGPNSEYGIHFSGMTPHNIEVTEIPVDGDEAVILASFHAG